MKRTTREILAGRSKDFSVVPTDGEVHQVAFGRGKVARRFGSGSEPSSSDFHSSSSSLEGKGEALKSPQIEVSMKNKKNKKNGFVNFGFDEDDDDAVSRAATPLAVGNQENIFSTSHSSNNQSSALKRADFARKREDAYTAHRYVWSNLYPYPYPYPFPYPFPYPYPYPNPRRVMAN